MACNAIRLLTDTECGVCGRTVPAVYAVSTGDVEYPTWLVVCTGCTIGLSGLWVAELMFNFKGEGWPGERAGGRGLSWTTKS